MLLLRGWIKEEAVYSQCSVSTADGVVGSVYCQGAADEREEVV